MSDKDKLVNLLRGFGVEYRKCISVSKGLETIEIRCEQGMEKVSGYGGFVTVFQFSRDGQFRSMGAWE